MNYALSIHYKTHRDDNPPPFSHPPATPPHHTFHSKASPNLANLQLNASAVIICGAHKACCLQDAGGDPELAKVALHRAQRGCPLPGGEGPSGQDPGDRPCSAHRHPGHHQPPLVPPPPPKPPLPSPGCTFVNRLLIPSPPYTPSNSYTALQITSPSPPPLLAFLIPSETL